jgi:hypothetical protein
MSLTTLDAVLQFLYGWMPLIAGLAGVWIWQRYGNLGWGLFGTIALLQLLGSTWWPAVALEPSSERLTWFTIALVAFWSTGIVQRVRGKAAAPAEIEPATGNETEGSDEGI